jgi:hypothetical protein
MAQKKSYTAEQKVLILRFCFKYLQRTNRKQTTTVKGGGYEYKELADSIGQSFIIC